MKQRIGVIFCGWGTLDLLDRSLAPWLSLRMNPDYDIKICGVSVKFAGFEGEDDGTRERLRWYRENYEIDHIIDSPDNIAETQARGAALTWLREQECDIVIQFDSDEVIDIESIKRMLNFVNANPFVCWFRFSYANLVFDEKTRLAEPFTPSRLFRMKFAGMTAWAFSGDNDICYSHERGADGRARNDTGSYYTFPYELPSLTIPESIFRPLHYTWLNNERSRLKQSYQWKRWGNCSFSWDDSQGGLIFNPALPMPKTINE